MVLYELIEFGLIIEDLWIEALRNKLERVLEMCSAEQAHRVHGYMGWVTCVL